MNWTFVMERLCGSLLPAIKSRINPYTTLARRQLHLAQLHQIISNYDLFEELRCRDRLADAPSSLETVYAECTFLIFPLVIYNLKLKTQIHFPSYGRPFSNINPMTLLGARSPYISLMYSIYHSQLSFRSSQQSCHAGES